MLLHVTTKAGCKRFGFAIARPDGRRKEGMRDVRNATILTQIAARARERRSI